MHAGLTPATLDPFRAALLEARRVLDLTLSDPALTTRLAAIPAVLASCVRAGGKILVIGNGGSACDAAHFAEELTGRFRADRRPLPAIACVDAGHITCTANDYGFDQVFARWVQALGRSGDVLIVLSTSGRSPNILHALDAAHAAAITRISLLGKDGGAAARQCEHAFILPGETSDRIQELHMLILHAWVEGVELELGLAQPHATRPPS